jgi:hypothetical protein
MLIHPNLCLGRAAHDPARVAAVKPHATGGKPIATPDRRQAIRWAPSLVQNDALPTCTVAGLINSARWWALLRGGFDLTNIEANELAFFAKVAGVPDVITAIAQVPGLVMLDVLEYAQKNGFDVGNGNRLVPEYNSIPTTDAIMDAIVTRGSAYTGVRLYEADMQPGAVWRGGIANAGKLVGGHAIIETDCRGGVFDIATWGGMTQADIEWLLARIDEAYSITWTFPVTA